MGDGHRLGTLDLERSLHREGKVQTDASLVREQEGLLHVITDFSSALKVLVLHGVDGDFDNLLDDDVLVLHLRNRILLSVSPLVQEKVRRHRSSFDPKLDGSHGLPLQPSLLRRTGLPVRTSPAPGTSPSPAVQGGDARISHEARERFGMLPLRIGYHQTVHQLTPQLLVTYLLVRDDLLQCDCKLLLCVLWKSRCDRLDVERTFESWLLVKPQFDVEGLSTRRTLVEGKRNDPVVLRVVRRLPHAPLQQCIYWSRILHNNGPRQWLAVQGNIAELHVGQLRVRHHI
mmetsp:Transcript_10626/g.21845  ORF Transcript_10626/g.21845 Transcript_10626/m.21845 type:complete len:287 (+) Transcript_10626:861-1721(+)